MGVDDTDILAKMQERGLVPARRALNDGTPLDTNYTIREMVLMWMPEDMADSRNTYYRDRANRAKRDFKKVICRLESRMYRHMVKVKKKVSS